MDWTGLIAVIPRIGLDCPASRYPRLWCGATYQQFATLCHVSNRYLFEQLWMWWLVMTNLFYCEV